MADRWIGEPPTGRERGVAAVILLVLLVAAANAFAFERSLLGLSPKQLLALAVLIGLPLGVYAGRRVGSGVNRTPEEVARFLREFIDGSGGQWDFDDFSSMPIADARLDSIRKRASRFNGPKSDHGISELKSLLAEAEALRTDQL